MHIQAKCEIIVNRNRTEGFHQQDKLRARDWTRSHKLRAEFTGGQISGAKEVRGESTWPMAGTMLNLTVRANSEPREHIHARWGAHGTASKVNSILHYAVITIRLRNSVERLLYRSVWRQRSEPFMVICCAKAVQNYHIWDDLVKITCFSDFAVPALGGSPRPEKSETPWEKKIPNKLQKFSSVRKSSVGEVALYKPLRGGLQSVLIPVVELSFSLCDLMPKLPGALQHFPIDSTTWVWAITPKRIVR
ncbi:hypothetical protein R3P38DRAFT_2793050 [Favolaschia claudopus]|uniref:Uncharacterized protein n=1 Tax=Favolaschia claudopus TaxID=2862362 RepID=A0AAW0ADV2_9AGAR